MTKTDHLQFETIKLANGITIFWRPDKSIEYTAIRVMMPVGTAHNTGSIEPGSFHLLEHLIAEQPLNGSDQLVQNWLGLKGGYSNAVTYGHYTTHLLTVPSSNLAEVLPAYCATLFRPQFTSELINKQVSVIANERRQAERWYPSGSELSQYLRTQWINTTPWPIEQLFGDEQQQATMGPDRFSALHRYYFSPQTVVIASGSGNLKPLLAYLGSLQTKRHRLPTSEITPTWARQTIHQQPFRDLSHHLLFYGGLLAGTPEPAEVRALIFIIKYLTNSIHGPLYHWLRNQLGWAYNLDHEIYRGPAHLEWQLSVSLNSVKQAQSVKRQLPAKIKEALTNQTAVDCEVERIMAVSRAFDFQVVENNVGDAEFFYRTYGRIIPVKDWLAYIERCHNLTYLNKIFQKYFAPKVTGWLIATPD